MFADDPVLRLRPGKTTWRRIDDEVVVLDLETSRYLTLNVTGGVLWELLDSGATRSQMVDHLVAGYAVDHSHAKADVEAFVIACQGQDVIEVIDDPARTSG